MNREAESTCRLSLNVYLVFYPREDHPLYKTFHLLATAHAPISSFFAGPVGLISKSKMSIGSPRVIQAFGICQCEPPFTN